MSTNGEEEEGDNRVELYDDTVELTTSTRSRRESSHGGLFMREQDADWLESIHVHGGPNKTGMTPVLTSQTLTLEADAPLPPFSLTDDDVVEGALPSTMYSLDKETLEPAASSSLPLDPISLSPTNVKPIKSHLDAHSTVNSESKENHVSALGSMAMVRDGPRFDEQSVSRSEVAVASSSRRVLSGTIYETEESHPFVPDPQSMTNDAATGSASVPRGTASLSLASRETPTAALPAEPTERVHPKDDAEDSSTEAKERRKMTEAAQFAEALGVSEDHYELLQIIEEDDECDNVHGADDDDDDDATEIIHIQQQQRNPVGGLLPIKLRSSVTTGSTHQGNGLLPPPSFLNTAGGERGIPTVVLEESPETPIKARTKVLPATTPSTVQSSPRSSGFLAQLPDSAASMCPSHDFVYKGIGANPPDIVKRGTTRGNYAQLHRKAWLEVTDKYHRYGKNLRLYYRYWESEGHPTNIFFDWLDSKGDAAGNELPELKDCPRRQLDSDTVLYITNPAVTQGYAIQVVVEEDGHDNSADGLRRGRMFDVDGQPVVTGPDGWIFVLRDNVLYGAKKITSISGQSRQRFHHSSFFGGKAVAAAGIFITDDNGFLTRLYPHSGHYRPGEAHMQRVLFFLYHEGVDLRSFEMDTQQIMHVARDCEPAPPSEKANGTTMVKTEKKKKVEALHLLPAFYIACFLAHKARCIGEGLFAQIHQIRQSDVASVSEALAVIDQGGYWRRNKKK